MRRILKVILAAVDTLIISVMAVIIYFNQCLPGNYYVTDGGRIVLPDIVQTSVSVTEAALSGKTELKLLGFIPIKTVNVKQIETPVLVPAGEPFGIKLLTDGVIVVEVSSFETEVGFAAPALECGIEAGDIIKSIDNVKVNSNSDVEKIIASSGGKSVEVKYVRDNVTCTAELTPLKCAADEKYRAGLWVRDSSAGIGTMTFYDPVTKGFVGLGHPVCDVDTGEIMPLYSGEIVKVSINGVKKGRAGVPGELMGGFISAFAMGSMEMNEQSGVYGYIEDYSSLNEAIPLAMRQEIKIGKAYIYTTISGTTPEKYEVMIEKIDLSDNEEFKNLIIRITDERLLDKTGGIVQGMSGSPIIQNGKLVGAVTHVFINNPEKGYGIFADTMYEQLTKMN